MSYANSTPFLAGLLLYFLLLAEFNVLHLSENETPCNATPTACCCLDPPPFRLPGWSVGRCSNCASRWGRGERSPPPPALVAKTTVGKAREKRTTVAVLPQQAQAKDSPQIVVMETPLNGYGSRGLTANIQIVVISDLRC